MNTISPEQLTERTPKSRDTANCNTVKIEIVLNNKMRAYTKRIACNQNGSVFIGKDGPVNMVKFERYHVCAL